jgi:hypothetical protein
MSTSQALLLNEITTIQKQKELAFVLIFSAQKYFPIRHLNLSTKTDVSTLVSPNQGCAEKYSQD